MIGLTYGEETMTLS